MKMIRVTTSRAMHLTEEVIALLKAGKNPYDTIEPQGPILETIQIVGTR